MGLIETRSMPEIKQSQSEKDAKHLRDTLFEKKNYIKQLTTASSCMEDRCPGCLAASTEISQPLDSETLPWLAIPATQP